MRLRFRILGVTICSLDFDLGPALEFVEDEAADDELSVANEECGRQITGGGAHNFERDLSPIDAQGEEPAYWDRARFGFNV